MSSFTSVSDSDPNTLSTPPELLAPAGTLLALLAAVQNGADAVYMGASRFSARAYAGNFSDSELAAGIDYAHAFGRKVYVTLNTLYRDEELADVAALFDALYMHGVDAVIVQDLGLLSLLAEKYPGFAFHASTQMTVHNSYHAAFLQKRGIVRVVPARENTVSELAEIKKAGVEVETFVHGALCICYSGQCLFSSLVGGRSGNRGKCAQPCRKKYTLLAAGQPVSTDGSYLLSPKDLNASQNIEALISAGVDSFKIEGRMKKPEYVAGVVSVYRKIIDRITEEKAGQISVRDVSEEQEVLKKLFNRDFTDGYFLKNPGTDLMSRRLPYNKGLRIGTIESADRKNAKITLSLTSVLSAHDGISIGDIGKNTSSLEDPRRGFTVKKMFIGRRIADKAGPGDVVEISLPEAPDSKTAFPSVGEAVYKTFDFGLQRTLLKTFPFPDSSEEERDARMKEAVAAAYADAENLVPSPTAPSLSSNRFPISEMVEALSPPESVRLSVSFVCRIRVGAPILIIASDFCGHAVEVYSDYIVEASQKSAFSKEQARDMLFKLGQSIYETESADVSVDGECFVPVGEFKNVRNQALQALLSRRILAARRMPKVPPSTDTDLSNIPLFDELPALISVSVYSKSALLAALDAGADRIYIGGDFYQDPLTKKSYGVTAEAVKGLKLSASQLNRIYFKTPFVVKEEEFEMLRQTLRVLKSIGISGISASNAGVYEFLLSDPEFSGFFKIAAESSFNIFNSFAADLLFLSGAESVLLSPELSAAEIESLIRFSASRVNRHAPIFECTVHGRQRLMVTEHPLLQSLLKDAGPLLSETSVSAAEDTENIFNYALKDAKNFIFPVLVDSNGRNHIFNSRILNALDLLPRLRKAGVSVFRIDGFGYAASELADRIRQYREKLSDPLSKSLSGSEPKVSQDGGEFTHGNFLRRID